LNHANGHNDSDMSGGEAKPMTRLAATKLRLNRYYVAIYINWMYLIIMYVIPFVLLLSLNWKIWNEIKLARLR